jgi:hypothetical protein
MNSSSLLPVRETQTLLLLACYRYLSQRQLAAFLFDGNDSIKPLSRQVVTRRILSRLQGRNLLAATTRLIGGPVGGSTRLAYSLTSSGAQLAGDLNGEIPLRRRPTRGTFLTQHALATADVALAFRRSALGRPGHEVIEWECDQQAAQRLGTSVVVPDAHLVYATETQELDAFIEVDLGTEGTRFFARKIERYLELYRSGTWRERLPVWPIVLTVAPTEHRALALQRATEALLRSQSDEARLRQETEFAFCSLHRLVLDGPSSAIWRVAGREGLTRLFSGVIGNESPLD